VWTFHQQVLQFDVCYLGAEQHEKQDEWEELLEEVVAT
jgi:hypothetical protein